MYNVSRDINVPSNWFMFWNDIIQYCVELSSTYMFVRVGLYNITRYSKNLKNLAKSIFQIKKLICLNNKTLLNQMINNTMENKGNKTNNDG